MVVVRTADLRQPSAWRRTTQSTELKDGPERNKSAGCIEMEFMSREAIRRTNVVKMEIRRLQSVRDSRRSVLQGSGSSRASATISTDPRGGRDFGLVPCALPMHRRGKGPSAMERCALALERKPEGWMTCEDYVSPAVIAAQEEATRLAVEAVEAELAAEAKAKADAEAAEAAHKAEEDRRVAEAIAAHEARLKELRAEVLLHSGVSGKLV